jgi:hypothetical protein
VSSEGHCSSLDRLVAELAEPLARLRGGSSDDRLSAARLSVLLSRAEVRAWSVDALDAPGLVLGRCPLGSGRAWLSLAREPLGEPAPGAYLVGRAIPVGPGQWLLMGRISVVAGESAVAEFERLLRSLRAPRGEFWRVHGGVLARTARAWAVPSAPRAILAA